MLLLAACTSGGGDAEPEREKGPGPIVDRVPSTTAPLVLATSPRRPPLDISLTLARRLIRGEVDDWSQLGEPPAPLTVTRNPARLSGPSSSAVAILRAHELVPTVRVVRVDGVHPLLEPDRYRPREPTGDPAPKVTTMTVVGDLMLGRRVRSVAAQAGDPGHQLRALTGHLRRADLTIGNLESTLSEAGAPTQGSDSFAAPPAVASELVDAGFDAVSLANNHAGDFGPAALVETVRRLRAAALPTFGAGRSARQAWAPVLLERHGVRFGFLGFNAIGETPDVADGGPGAVSIAMPPRTGPLDLGQLRRFQAAVRRLDQRADVVVVLPHWGSQYTHRPEPIQHRVARALVRAGADVVVGGHPHWVQGAELVGGRLVVHSLGNFVFDMDFMERTMEGLVLDLVFWDEHLVGVDYLPYRMDPDFTPRRATWEAAAENLAGFWAFTRF